MHDAELDVTALRKLTDACKRIYKKHTGEEFPGTHRSCSGRRLSLAAWASPRSSVSTRSEIDVVAKTITVNGTQLVRLASWVGRETRPALKLGICGEHGGHPESIRFFHEAWLDYVSCSPFRVPIARVAAAQAAIA